MYLVDMGQAEADTRSILRIFNIAFEGLARFFQRLADFMDQPIQRGKIAVICHAELSSRYSRPERIFLSFFTNVSLHLVIASALHFGVFPIHHFAQADY